MYKYKSLIILFLILGNQQILRAQVVKGTVTDATTGKGIESAHIQFKNTSWVAVSDKQGKFVITDFQDSSKVVRITAIGYAPKEVVCEKSHELQVLLEPSSLLLNNAVVVTAQRSEQMSFDVMQSVTNLSQQEIANKQSRSTPEALMGEAGIWVQKTNHGSGSPIIRGLVGNQVLLMVDGIRMNNATYRYGPNQYLSTIDPGLVSSVETIRGSGSVLYGSDALGGVVNVLSITPTFSDELKVNGSILAKWMSAGMEKTGRGEMDVSTRKIAFAGGFSMHDFGDVLAGDSLGLLVPTAYQENAFDAKVILRTSASSLLTASYQYDKQKEVPRYDQVTQGGFKFYNFDPQQRQLGYVRWETLTKSRWFQSLRFTTSFNQTLEVIKAQKNSAVDYKENQDKVHTTGMIAEVQSNPLTGWSIQSGMEYYYDKVNSTATIINSATNSETTVRGSYADGATSSNMAIYSNHQYDRTNYQLNGGIRFNAVTVSVEDIIFGNQEIRPNAFVGQFGAMWKINTALRMYAHANTGFRAPNVDDMSKFGAVETGVFEIPASGLSPEKSLTVESGIKFKKPKYTGAFSVYQTQLDDLIDRVPATYQGSSSIEGRTVYQKQNVGEAIVKGIEADFGWTFLKSFTLTANATYTYGQNITKDEPIRRIPPLFGRMNLHYQHHSGWWLRGEWVTAGSQDRLAAGDKSDVRISIRLVDGAMPGWNIFNLYTGYTYKSFTFNVAAQNIFDKAYRVYASGIDGYGRSMLASLQIRF